MDTYEISLGPVENGLYFGKKAKRMYLLQKADREERQGKPYSSSEQIYVCDDESISL
jgi:hypothetical protein